MTDTIDRLVRMLDEEREGHRKAREHEGREAMIRHEVQQTLERSRKELSAEIGLRTAAVETVHELRRWIDLLYKKVPEKDRKTWPKRPT